MLKFVKEKHVGQIRTGRAKKVCVASTGKCPLKILTLPLLHRVQPEKLGSEIGPRSSVCVVAHIFIYTPDTLWPIQYSLF